MGSVKSKKRKIANRLDFQSEFDYNVYKNAVCNETAINSLVNRHTAIQKLPSFFISYRMELQND